jgi:hypothetical protein
MQHLEVSCAVRPIYGSLSTKRLKVVTLLTCTGVLTCSDAQLAVLSEVSSASLSFQDKCQNSTSNQDQAFVL